MEKSIVYKALMVKEKTRDRVVIKAKKLKLTVDEYILSLLKK